jgi:Delta14-sterol reductase
MFIRLGALGITFGLPILVYLFGLLCNDVSGCPAPLLLTPSTLTLDKLKQEVGWQGISTIINKEAFAANLGWYLSSLVLYAILPAHELEGSALSSGGRLKYRLNGSNSTTKLHRLVTDCV